ncbi:hypothetical protein KZZ52_58900 [Dactylosporangium sp. AC04546]|uniref:hypothetical protein n=1 Tax=Dactylosporangium sp. AC04546 TaxID=2862460 RepID=UPI001EDE0D5A|nr:hypothetical protein [Dactylosporangium sp. AC04546]WVK83662.1 hypothetical protein KZZ52_58900 [Dactylosporangium sp. AC04546]
MLFVVVDEAGRCLVALDEPGFDHGVEREECDGIVQFRSRENGFDGVRPATDLATARFLTGAGFVATAGVAVTLSALVTPWIGVPVGIVGVAVVGRRYVRQETAEVNVWNSRHRLLDAGPEAGIFGRAVMAARQTARSWPHLAPLVRLDSPRDELSTSLWVLAGLLRDHAVLREQVAELEQARVEVPERTGLRDELEDRISVVEDSRIPVYREIERRLTALETLAAECRAFVRDEQVVRNARRSIQRADLVLGRIAPPDPLAPDPAQDLAERTQAVIGAYRELQEGC